MRCKSSLQLYGAFLKKKSKAGEFLVYISNNVELIWDGNGVNDDFCYAFIYFLR
jgi:hypothetical protein